MNWSDEATERRSDGGFLPSSSLRRSVASSPAFHPSSLFFIVVGAALVVAGLWVWGRAGDWSWTQGAQRPEIMGMAIRCAGAGIIAAGELVWIALVVNRIYPDDAFGRLLQWAAAGAMLVALVCAAALAWAGR
jgi:hypothetical protein